MVLLPGEDRTTTRRGLCGTRQRQAAGGIVRGATGAGDVAAGLRYAQAEGLEIAVRGGGHGYWGAAVPEGGLMIDLSPSTTSSSTRSPAGARGRGRVVRELDAATQEHGLAVPAGMIGHTGVGGLTLGGGWAG